MPTYTQATLEEAGHLYSKSDAVKRTGRAYDDGDYLEFLNMFSGLKEHEIPNELFLKVHGLLAAKQRRIRNLAKTALFNRGYPLKLPK